MQKIKQIVFYLIFFLFILAFGASAISFDYDLWARLIVGMSVFQKGNVLKQDFLSYTPTHQWFDHEWLSGFVFYVTHHFSSVFGLMMLQAILIFFIFVFVLKTIKLRGLKNTTAYNFLFYFIAFMSMSEVLNQPVRCQLFSFLFFTVFIYVLELARQGKNKPLVLLPFIMLIWNNLHGGCVIGIGLILIYLLGEFFNKAECKKYFYILIPTVLVLLINPWGYQYLNFLASASTMPRPDVIEWWGLFSKYHVFNYICFKLFATIILFVEVYLLYNSKKQGQLNIDWTKFLVLFSTLFYALLHVKLIPFAVISIMIFSYNDFYAVYNLLFKSQCYKLSITRQILVYWIVLVYAFSIFKTRPIEPILNWNKYPLQEIEFIKINDLKGNLFINFGLGSYASYKLYPNNRIFMDGRYEEVYYPYMLPLMKKFYLVLPGWDELLRKFPPDVMVIEKFYPVFKKISNDKDWILIFQGESYGVFVRRNDLKAYYALPSYDIDYYRNSLFDTKINFVLQSKDG